MCSEHWPYKTNKKPISGKKHVSKTFLESMHKNGLKADKREDRRINRTRQNNKRADRKVESNDSPEIPDGGVGHRAHITCKNRSTAKETAKMSHFEISKLFCAY